jgi:hypothetical protein
MRWGKTIGRGCGALALAFLCGCAYDGRTLQPGRSTLQDVVATMGKPAAEWTNPDHSMQLSYPRGPAGYHSYMVYLDPEGRVESVRDVMAEASFNEIRRGMTGDDVVRAIGPPVPAWTNYFAARRELVWEWRYCNEYGELARFDVLLDGDRHDVRSTTSRPEDCGPDACHCGH